MELLSSTTLTAQIISYWPSFFWHFHFSLVPSALGALYGDGKATLVPAGGGSGMGSSS